MPLKISFATIILIYSFASCLKTRNPPYSYQDLTKNEQKACLEHMYKKMDANFDHKLTPKELQTWISNIHNKTIENSISVRFAFVDMDNDSYVTWAEFRNTSYGLSNDFINSKEYSEENFKVLKKAFIADKNRFETADQNRDGRLSVDEFRSFIAPERFPHMHHQMVEETLGDLDADEDGRVSVEEYLSAVMHTQVGDHLEGVAEREYEYFHTHRDADGDGKLDKYEVESWIVPQGDPSKVEADWLIDEADGDGDGLLSKKEVIDSLSVFISSSATAHGQELLKMHQEL